MDLFRLCPRIEIISPEHIREEIRNRAMLTSELYRNSVTGDTAIDGTGDDLTLDNITEYRYDKGK